VEEGRRDSDAGDQETYTVTEAAKILRVTDRAVRKWLADGTLEGEQDGSGRWHVPQRAVHARLEERPPRPAKLPQEGGRSAPRGSPEAAPEMLEIVRDLERRLGRAEA
jgi:excisionase family DNA binding protein